MKAIRRDIDLSSSGLGSGGSTPLDGNGGGGLTRNGRPSSFGNVFASGGGKGGGTTDKITATTTATTMAGDELSVRGGENKILFFLIISFFPLPLVLLWGLKRESKNAFNLVGRWVLGSCLNDTPLFGVRTLYRDTFLFGVPSHKIWPYSKVYN